MAPFCLIKFDRACKRAASAFCSARNWAGVFLLLGILEKCRGARTWWHTQTRQNRNGWEGMLSTCEAVGMLNDHRAKTWRWDRGARRHERHLIRLGGTPKPQPRHILLETTWRPTQPEDDSIIKHYGSQTTRREKKACRTDCNGIRQVVRAKRPQRMSPGN